MIRTFDFDGLALALDDEINEVTCSNRNGYAVRIRLPDGTIHEVAPSASVQVSMSSDGVVRVKGK